MITEIKNFENYSNNIKDYIEKSDYKTKFFIKKLGLSEPTFYRKLKNHLFTVKELVSLSEVFFPSEFYEYKIKESIKKGEEDLKEGRVEDAIYFVKKLKKKHL